MPASERWRVEIQDEDPEMNCITYMDTDKAAEFALAYVGVPGTREIKITRVGRNAR